MSSPRGRRLTIRSPSTEIARLADDIDATLRTRASGGVGVRPGLERHLRRGPKQYARQAGGKFPNIAVSLAFLRQVLLDPRLKQPMVDLPLVGHDSASRVLTAPLTPAEVEALDLHSLRDLAKRYRVFSDMDTCAETSRYDGSVAVTRAELLAALRRPPSTTTQVNLCIVKPDTLDAGCSYAEMLQKRDGDAEVGEPTVFLSHAWRYCFVDFVGAILDRFEGDAVGSASVRVWNDIFVEDQNSTYAKPAEYFFTAFKDAVASIGHTVLVLAPWDAPIPATRAWCLWEIYSTLIAESRFEVVLSRTERERFRGEVLSLPTKHGAKGRGINMVWKALSGIAVEKAEAYLVDDRDKILRHVEEGPGFVEFNRQVASLLQDWMSRVATDHAFDHLETISQCDALDGRVVDPTRRLSHPKPALPAACGPAENTAEDSVMSAVRVVELLYLQEKYHEALDLAERTKEVAMQAGVLECKSGARLIGDVGDIELRLGRVECAVESKKEAMKIFESLGLGHSRDAAYVLTTIGGLQDQLGDYTSARASFGDARNVYSDIGELHTAAGATLALMIGHLECNEGNFEEGLRSFETAKTTRRASQMLETPAGADVEESLGDAKRALKDYAGAQASYLEARDIRRHLASLATPGGATLLKKISENEVMVNSTAADVGRTPPESPRQARSLRRSSTLVPADDLSPPGSPGRGSGTLVQDQSWHLPEDTEFNARGSMSLHM